MPPSAIDIDVVAETDTVRVEPAHLVSTIRLILTIGIDRRHIPHTTQSAWYP